MAAYTPSASRKQRTSSVIPDRIELAPKAINPLYSASLRVLNLEEHQFCSPTPRYSAKR